MSFLTMQQLKKDQPLVRQSVPNMNKDPSVRKMKHRVVTTN